MPKDKTAEKLKDNKDQDEVELKPAGSPSVSWPFLSKRTEKNIRKLSEHHADKILGLVRR